MRTHLTLTALLALSISSCADEPARPAALTGLFDAAEIDVASKIPGRVKDLLVKEGDAVKKDQKLLVIESEEMKAKIDQVEAAIEASKAKLKLATRGARPEEKDAAKKALDAAQHQVELAQKMYDRMAELRKQNAIPQAKFDEVDFKLKVARDQLAMAEARSELVQKGARQEELEALRALVKQGEGTLAEVRSYNKETVQLAPLAGEVTKVVLHQGELAATGYPILTIVDLSDVWATFAVREDRLTKIKKGDTIQALVPALGRTVELQIFTIAALGDFATWKATSERNSFDLKSFEVKARPVRPEPGLRPGMSARWSVQP